MKLVRFYPLNYYPISPRLGVVEGAKVIDLASAYRVYLIKSNQCEVSSAKKISEILFPEDVVAFFENGIISMEAAKKGIELANENACEFYNEKTYYHLNEVELLSPIGRPNSLRDFISFEEHIKNARAKKNESVPKQWYEIPAYYKGNPDTIIGPNEEIIWPSYSKKMDYELEIACIIGKSGKNIIAEEADEYIAGFTIMNDFSARDIQAKEVEVGLGPAKGKDFATALGPYIVTKDSLVNPYNLEMTARVNGEIWSRGNSSTIYRTFNKMIEYVSNDEGIKAGDVFGSGTVGLGCGLELNKFIKINDEIELEIEGLGILKNKIVGN